MTLYNDDFLNVLSTLAKSSIDLILTDPPYGHNNNNGDLAHCREVALGLSQNIKEARPILGDGPEANDLARELFKQAARVLKPGGVICCCCAGGGGKDPQFARWALWMDEVLNFKQMVVWDKGPIGLGWHYRRSYETILVAQRKGGKCKWYDDSHHIENIIRPGDYNIKKIIPTKAQHPTEKPVELMEHFIKLHTKPGDVVLDPFMGSGTTGVACQKTGREFIGIELDKAFYDMAVARMEAA